MQVIGLLSDLWVGILRELAIQSQIITHLKYLNIDIDFLQETHLHSKDQAKLTSPWAANTLLSNFGSNGRGVAIMLTKRVQFTSKNVITDKQGRYLIVVCMLFQNPVMLINIYAPNFDNPNFMIRLFENLPPIHDHLLLFGGNFNCVIDPSLDRSRPRTLIQLSMSKIISEYMDNNGCVDPWRFKNPKSKVFTFFSRVHQSYSRIDYFFIGSSLISKITSVEYHQIIISDHAPLSLDIQFHTGLRYASPWLNSSFLEIYFFCFNISWHFLSTNQPTTTFSYSLLSETQKVYLLWNLWNGDRYNKQWIKQQ